MNLYGSAPLTQGVSPFEHLRERGLQTHESPRWLARLCGWVIAVVPCSTVVLKGALSYRCIIGVVGTTPTQKFRRPAHEAVYLVRPDGRCGRIFIERGKRLLTQREGRSANFPSPLRTTAGTDAGAFSGRYCDWDLAVLVARINTHASPRYVATDSRLRASVCVSLIVEDEPRKRIGVYGAMPSR